VGPFRRWECWKRKSLWVCRAVVSLFSSEKVEALVEKTFFGEKSHTGVQNLREEMDRNWLGGSKVEHVGRGVGHFVPRNLMSKSKNSERTEGWGKCWKKEKIGEKKRGAALDQKKHK